MEQPYAITLGVETSLANHTGSWRQERPQYVSLMPPCNNACPAGENIQNWLYIAEDGSYEEAWRALIIENPFPAIMGRVCYHPCQTVCNRAQLDEAVGINSVERFLGDHAIEKGWSIPVTAQPTGRRILIVGAGPAGLSAAYHLRRLGHDVTVRDSMNAPGGMMRYGIPKYRLPREILDAEIKRIEDMGVRFEMNTRTTDVRDAIEEGFDAAFLAVGAHISKRAYIPAGEAARILDAISVLHDVEDGQAPMLGRKVVVYGGGNTAIDVARTAKRLGAEESIIVYRRTREKAPANDTEITEALEEGVLIKWLSTIKQADEGHLTVEKMKLDEKGFPQPTGEFEELEADSLVLALGQESDLTLLQGVPELEVIDGVLKVDSMMMTGYPGIFAGGDMVPAERTVTTSIGHGKKAARNIDAWLRKVEYKGGEKPTVVEYKDLNPWYYSDAPHAVRPRLEGARRATTFDEVVQGLDESTALYEARRCMSCGNCFECDNCFGVCPDNAVIKLGPGKGFEFNLDYCKGCGICVSECPSGSIIMIPEKS
ncbi:MAG: NAD(P)-binding protein [Candidatus Nanopelagicaceae bacterium]|jgi:NADPH-dependent glutamate synthase beta subunit-like oxidoreductase